MWAPGYLGFMSSNHNGMLRMYETFGNGGATTMKRKVEPPEGEGGPGRMNATKREWYRPWPPYKEVEWSLRNNTNYMETAVLAALQYTARNGSEMLRNFWRRGASAVRRGSDEKPYAIVIPEKQDDRRRLAHLIDLLRAQGIEVSRAGAAFKVKEGEFPAGTTSKRPPGRRQDDSGDGRAVTSLEALMDGRVLAVDRKEQPSTPLPRFERKAAGSYEALLVGQREGDAPLERPERRWKARETDDGVQDDVRLGHVQQRREIAADLRVLHAKFSGQRVELAGAGRERADLELVVAVDDVERLAPDRPRGAQDRNSLHARNCR
jgi:hypothetical protein